MSDPKYKISINDLERVGGIKKLEADGFSRSQIMDAVHKQTNCAEFSHKTRTQQREMVQNLFDRSVNK